MNKILEILLQGMALLITLILKVALLVCQQSYFAIFHENSLLGCDIVQRSRAVSMLCRNLLHHLRALSSTANINATHFSKMLPPIED
jgi:hypothetical protein